MKFVVAVVVLALALEAQSGLIPLSYVSSPLSYTAVSAPGYYAAAPGSFAVNAPADTSYSNHIIGSPLLGDYSSAPLVTTYTAPAVAEGTYLTQTRGAVHALLGRATSLKHLPIGW